VYEAWISANTIVVETEYPRATRPGLGAYLSWLDISLPAGMDGPRHDPASRVPTVREVGGRFLRVWAHWVYEIVSGSAVRGARRAPAGNFVFEEGAR